MKKNKNEKNDQPGIHQNPESGNAGNEEKVTGNDYHFPIIEDLYLNEEERDLKAVFEQNNAFTDDEKKQNENNPDPEKSGYPLNPYLVNLKPNVAKPDIVQKKIEDQEREPSDDNYHDQGDNSIPDSSGKQKNNQDH